MWAKSVPTRRNYRTKKKSAEPALFYTDSAELLVSVCDLSMLMLLSFQQDEFVLTVSKSWAFQMPDSATIEVYKINRGGGHYQLIIYLTSLSDIFRGLLAADIDIFAETQIFNLARLFVKEKNEIVIVGTSNDFVHASGEA